jgi:hypothetical protein
MPHPSAGFAEDLAPADDRRIVVHRFNGANSLSFLKNAFQFYAERRTFAIDRPDLDLDRVPGLVVAGDVVSAADHGWGRFDHVPSWSDDPAQIVFTSGTEGRPKPILLSHANLADVVARLNAVMEVDAGIREYIGVPVTYSFGLGRARAVSAAGGALYLPARGFDPHEIRDMLARDEINAVSAVPSLWRVLLAHPGVIGALGAKVRWIEIGSQYMARAEKEAMKALFPEARIVQHYGLTEASRTTFLDVSRTAGEALESVGAPTGAVEVAIGPDGAVRIRGPHVALGALDETGRRRPLVDAEGWLVTRDRGELRDGLLWYGGRLDDQINLGGVKFAAEALERDVAALIPSAPLDFAIAAIPDPVRGDGILLACGPEAAEIADLLEAALRATLRRRGADPGRSLQVLRVAALPRTDTGKVRRPALRERFLALDAAARPEPAPDGAGEALSPAELRVAAAWRRVLGAAGITRASSFHDLGGDSLGAVQIGLAMEAAGFAPAQIRATLEGRPLAEVAALDAAAMSDVERRGGAETAGAAALPARTAVQWSIGALRGFMVLLVIVVHWAPGVLERLGEGAAALNHTLSPLWRFGTPGFAMVFGMGIGHFLLPEFAANRAAVMRRLMTALALVFSGLVLLAAAYIARALLRGEAPSGLLVAHGFYNVLAYYCLALATAPLWLAGLARIKASPPVLLLLAGAIWAVGWGVAAVTPAGQVDGLLEWPRLMLVANYGYFRMTAVVFAGIAVGLWLRGAEPRRAAVQLTLVGAAILAATLGVALENRFALSAMFGGPPLRSLLASIGYAGLATLLLGLVMTVFDAWARLGAAPRAGARALVVTGALALPLFAFHGLVIPVKDILVLTGVPEVLALALSMGAFLAGAGYAWRRLDRMFFRGI